MSIIKIRPSSSPSYYFDRSFSGTWWKQIVWLSAAVLFAFIFFWGVSLYLFPNPEDFEVVGSREPEGRFMLLFRLFYDPGSIEHLTLGARSFGVVVIIVGLILFMGMLISVVSNILERHIQRYLSGYFDYRFHEHQIILGYDKTVPGLIKNNIYGSLRGKEGILIISEKPTETIRKDLASQLSPLELKRVVIKNGNRNSEQILKEISVTEAKKIWVVGEENEYDHDSLNIDCISKIVGICESKEKRAHEQKIKILEKLKSYAWIKKKIESLSETTKRRVLNVWNRIYRFDKGIEAIKRAIDVNEKIDKEIKETQDKKVKAEKEKEKLTVPYSYQGKLNVLAFFEKQSSFRAFQSTDISKNWKRFINFRASNFCDDWARYVLVDRGLSINEEGERQYRYPAVENPKKPIKIGAATESKKGEPITKDSDSHVHLVVMGMTEMGLSFALRAAHLLHLPNFTRDKNLKTVITLVDREANTKLVDFRNQYQSVFEIESATYKDFTQENAVEYELKPTKFTGDDADFLDVRFEFIKSNANSAHLRNYLSKCANDQNEVFSIALCYEDPDYNLQIGQNLPSEVYFPAEGNHPVPVFIKQCANGRMIDELRHSVKYHNLYPFGMFNECHIINEVDELRSKAINVTYDQCHDDNYNVRLDADGYVFTADYGQKDNVDSLWEGLQTALQWSNTYCLDCFELRRRNMGDENDHLKFKYKPDDNVLSIISEVEHNRWNMEKLLMGYRKPSEEELAKIIGAGKNDSYPDFAKKKMFVHRDLQSYEKLKEVDPGAIKYDQIIMANIENIMRLKG